MFAGDSTATGYQARGLTKKAISKYRARELQMEAFPVREHVLCGQTHRSSEAKALHSEKLKAYFEEHPDDKRALQRSRSEKLQTYIVLLLLLPVTGCSEHFASESL